MDEYDRIAEWYARTRSPAIGPGDLAAFLRPLAPSPGAAPEARVLDLGCGTGVPLAQELARRGYRVTGLDSSAEMIRRFRRNVPEARALHARAQEVDFAPGMFEAVVAWGVVFHLSETEQRAVFARVGRWLVPGGRFLFTSGGARGAREGTMDGVTFHYVSLGPEGYRTALAEAGLRLARHYTGEGENTVYVAAKAASGAGG